MSWNCVKCNDEGGELREIKEPEVEGKEVGLIWSSILCGNCWGLALTKLAITTVLYKEEVRQLKELVQKAENDHCGCLGGTLVGV